MTDWSWPHFLQFVDKKGDDDCWIWKGRTHRQGYGMMGKGRLAHRHAYFLAHGHCPTNKVVLHTCDNPACVNPVHLTIGTHEDNMKDARIKGKFSKHKKICSNGHEQTPENVMIRRTCRICANEKMRLYRAKINP